MPEQLKQFRIHFYGKNKRGVVINEFENFTAKNSDEAKEIAKQLGNNVWRFRNMLELKISVHELTFVTFFEVTPE